MPKVISEEIEDTLERIGRELMNGPGILADEGRDVLAAAGYIGRLKAEVAKLEAEAADALTVIWRYVNLVITKDDADGLFDVPGHQHERPRTLDTGEPCELCAAWHALATWHRVIATGQAKGNSNEAI